MARTQSHLFCAVAGTKYSPTWLKALGIDYIIYQSESKSLPFYYYNHANEAGAYLQFTVDFFDCLPEVRLPDALLEGGL